MTKIAIERYLKKYNVEFLVNEGLPEDVPDIKAIYVLPRQRMIFDVFQQLNYNKLQGLTMRNYEVFQPRTFEEFKNIISKIL
ncbi:MAG TPA: hypothetical protein ENH35_02920 [Candidatus Moranbacteria bacterium]|nr:hypothetical protein [Candidatus Pacearchaeota archaeon]HDZ85470.1 hypothetical protein [Candidatus Moranbacteria bacterium]